MVGLSDIPCVGEAVDRVSEATVDVLFRGLRYLLCYNSIVNNLTSEIENVNVQEDLISRKAVADRADGKIILDQVTKWQKDVQEVKSRADELSKQRPSWNPLTRFRMGRKAAHEAKNVAILTLSGAEHLKNKTADLPLDENIPNTATTYQTFGSREEAYVKLWEALVKEDGHPIIGIYGMPGVGKTTMMEKVWREAKGKNKFDKVARADVGDGNIDLKKLQNQFAGCLDCHFQSEDEGRRASQLKSSLLNAGNTLVILDDVWDQIPLEKIGIPLGDDIPKGCKILLTSRRKDVCLRIGCTDPIQIKELTDDEAWDMFKTTVATSENDSLLNTPLAKNVCDECARLPLLIHAVGNALKFDTESSWKNALSQLQDNHFDEIDGIEPPVSAGIQLSFDKLKKDAKTCLLLCSLFDEDAEIEIKMLADIATGSRLLNPRMDVRGLADKLQSSSLLLEGETSRTVKLHDIIRDVARCVAAKDPEYAFLFIRGGSFLPNVDGYSTRKLLQFAEEGDKFGFHVDMVCPKLHTLWLECNNQPPQFSNSFFQWIDNLKMLVLKGRHAFPEHISAQTFDKLTCLILDGCSLNETWPSIISESLEILRMSKCPIPNPLDLSKLKCLRKLEVICDNEIEIVENVRSTLPPTLEELHIPGGFRICDAEGKISSRPVSSELNKLSALKSLNIRLEDSECCPNENIVNDLLDFIIQVGDELDNYDSRWIRDSGVWNVEKSVTIKSRCIEGGVKVVVERAEEVILVNVKGSWNGFSNSRIHAFSTLKRLRITKCKEMEHLIACTQQNEIQQSRQPTPFSNLTFLCIDGCDELKYLFSASVAKCLLQLKELIIRDCERLEEVVISKESDDQTIIYFPKLIELELRSLPNLRRFYGEKRSSTEDVATTKPAGSECLFDGMVVFSSLEDLRIEGINTSEIWGGNSWNDNSFSELKSLSIIACPNLEFGISIAMLPTFQNLETLIIIDCESMRSEVEISRRESESESSNPPTLVALRSMELWYLPGLTQTGLNSKRTNFIYPILKKLTLVACSSLRNVFSPSIAKHLEKCLQSLFVMNCEMMSEIIGGEEEKEGERQNQFVFPHLTKLRLLDLPNFKSLCFSDSKTFTQNAASPTVRLFHQMVVLPSIEHLDIEGMNINEIWGGNCCNDNSFCQLKSLQIEKCHNLEFAIPLAMWPTFQNLEKLRIEDCNSVVSEVESSSSSPELTPHVALRSIYLSDLPVLTQTSLNSCNRNLYPSLEAIYISNCNSLKDVNLDEGNEEDSEEDSSDADSDSLEGEGSPDE